MTSEELFEIIGSADPEAVRDAYNYRAKAPKALKIFILAAAACLCLITGANVYKEHIREQISVPYTAGGDMGGLDGLFPEGVDPLISSVAVYPEGEDVRDVENAGILTLSEEEALSEQGLGEYLPEYLPKGFGFERAELYRTVMKNGNVYRMLRVTYTDAPIPQAVTFTDADGSAGAYLPENTVFPSQITLSLFDFKPRTEKIISPEDIDGDTVKSGYFTVAKGDIYIGIEALDHDGAFSAEDIIRIVESIG